MLFSSIGPRAVGRQLEVRFTLGADLESMNGLDRTACLLGARPVGARGHRPARVHVSSEINMRLGQFGPRTAHPTQLGDYHIEFPVPYAPRRALPDFATPRLYKDGHKT